MIEDTDGIQIEIDDSSGADDNPAVSELLRQKEQLESQLAATRQRAERAEASSQASYANQLDTYLAAQQQAAESAKAGVQTALEAGDWGKFAEQNEALAEAKANLATYQKEKAVQAVQARQQPAGDPTDQFIANLSGASKEWAIRNRDVLSSPAQLERVVAAHHIVKHETKIDSPDYFARIERLVGINKQNGQARSENGQYTRRSSVAPVAPVSAGNMSGGMNGGPQSVRLTPNEVSLAEDTFKVTAADVNAGWAKREEIGQPLGRVRFAKRKLAMQKSGAYDRGE